MANLAGISMYCCFTCNHSTFHFLPAQAWGRNASASNSVLSSSRTGFTHVGVRERKQKMQGAEYKWCEEGPRLCARVLLVWCTKSSPSRVTWVKVKGGSMRLAQEFGSLGHGYFSRKRRGKEIRSFSLEAASRDEGERFEQEAREAVGKVLLEAGLSPEDAKLVVSKAPVFIKELIVCGQDLEESDRLVVEGEEGTSDDDEDGVDSRDRVYQLANHSRGMSPLLESLGVPLPSVSRISYSLSSQRLPELLSKIRYLEELLAKSEPRNRPLDGLVRFMVKNLSVPIWEDENIQRTLSFFEKMNRNRGDLSALDKTNSSLPLLIEAFPQIFKRSLEDQMKPVIGFLEGLGIKGGNLGKVILCFPSILLQDPEKDLLPRKRTLKKVGIRVEDMGRMVVKYPWLLSKCVEDNVEVLVQFCEFIKIPKSKIDKSITKCPQLLGCSTTGVLQPMVHHINSYGLKSKRLGRALSQSPELLLHTPQEFDSVVTFLESVGVEANYISKLLRRSPEILGSSIDNTLQKKVKFLEELGVRRKKLGRIITFYPEILTMSVESALIPRINYLHQWGFARHEICRMAFKFPPLLGYNAEEVLSPKLEFLTTTMRRSVKDVVAYPRYFSHSLEKKIRPRARVLENRQIQCDLKTMLAKSDDQFAADYLGFGSLLILPTNKIVGGENSHP